MFESKIDVIFTQFAQQPQAFSGYTFSFLGGKNLEYVKIILINKIAMF